jgi:hypothetical protein
MPTSTTRPPFFSVPTTVPTPPALPPWPQLDPGVRQLVVVLLTRMILHHLPRADGVRGKEVADESR